MIERSKLGVLCFIGSEVFFFGVLIIAYIVYRPWAAPGPNASNSLEPATAGIFTALLLASSLTLWLAERSAKRARLGGLRLWLLTTVLLGAAFLLGQGREYLLLLSSGVTVNRNQFGSTFYTLTGFHGLHVFSGLVALLVMLGLALGDQIRGRRLAGLAAIGWYWHFVDVVWLIIFSLVYLLPLALGTR
jgi:heme/copper-type cytochrome/quinol oxidase subunit 3